MPELEHEEYYWHQLEGLAVNCKGELLGRVNAQPCPDGGDPLLVTYWGGKREDHDRSDSYASMIGFRKKAIHVACEFLGVPHESAQRLEDED